MSSVADDSRSISTTTQPDVPVNSPISGSIAGDAGVSATEVIDRVKTLTPDDGKYSFFLSHRCSWVLWARRQRLAGANGCLALRDRAGGRAGRQDGS